MALAQRDRRLHPPEQRARIRLLHLDVHRFVAVLGIDDDRQDQPLRVRAGKAAVSIGAPLHGRAYTVAIAEVGVVAHADLVAVVDDGRAGHREQERVHELDAAPIVHEERRQAAPDSEIDARLPIDRVALRPCSRALPPSPFRA